MSGNKFECCYYLNGSYIDICQACETPHFRAGGNTPRLSDNEECNLACRECQFWCWPICILIDTITCPYRIIKHIHNKPNITPNNDDSIKEQPI